MANRGFGKMINAPFTRMKLNLCPYCTHFERAGARDGASSDAWDHCQAKGTLISAAKSDKGRCPDYEISGETRLTELELKAEQESVDDHRAYNARMAGQS